MSKSSFSIAAVLFLSLAFSAGAAFAGGKECGGKKKDDGASALVVSPAQPLG